MIQRRRIIAWMSIEPFEYGDATLDVVAWLDAPGGPKCGSLKADFPTRGRVYTAAQLTRNIGLHECAVLEAESSDNHHDVHHWYASQFVASTFEVLLAPLVQNPIELYVWCKAIQLESPAQHVEFVIETSSGHFYGPFVPNPTNTGVKPKNSSLIYRWENHSICKANLPNTSRFVAYPIDGHQEALLFEPADAIKRLLRVSKDTHDLDWLSRDKTSQLTNLLSANYDVASCQWIKPVLPAALVEITNNGSESQTLCDALLAHPSIMQRVSEWKISIANAEKAKAEAALNDREIRIVAKETQQKELEACIATKRGEKESLIAEIGALAKERSALLESARTAFHEEMQRISENPSSLIILRQLLEPLTLQGNSNESLPFLQICEEKASVGEAAESLQAALAHNLARIGLIGGDRVSLVVTAAIHAGQPVYFTGLFAQLLCDATAQTLARPITLKAVTSAGILTPTSWPTSATNAVVKIYNVNMAAHELVLGDLHPKILFQTAMGSRGSVDLLATFISENDFFHTTQFLPGPVIDTSKLAFIRPRPNRPICLEPHGPSVEISADTDPLTRESIAKWSSDFANLCEGPTLLALKNACTVLEALVEHQSAATAEELLVLWWLAPRVAQFSLDDLEPALKERLKRHL